MSSPAARSETFPPCDDRRGLWRSLCESTVCLLIAVIIFRTYAIEGYLISTGSMAPHLLGYHQRVQCPTCGTLFTYGVAYDADPSAWARQMHASVMERIYCHNCGQQNIDLSLVPRNHGDQLLVFKQAYWGRLPRRWEVVVFRNPAATEEAYVKRVVGLPNESIQVRHGDVYADGIICRKSWSEQHALRILVHEHKAETTDRNQRWHVLPVSQEAPSWQAVADSFVFYGANEPQKWSWVEYEHRLYQGGNHETWVSLEVWPDTIHPELVPPAGLKFDAVNKRLRCIGVLPVQVVESLIAQCQDHAFVSALRQLQAASHVGPVTDLCIYNPLEHRAGRHSVSDLMLSLELSLAEGEGEFAVELHDGDDVYTFVLDTRHHEVRLFAAGDNNPVVSSPIASELLQRSLLIEVSLFDRQIMVAINGQVCLPAWLLAKDPPVHGVARPIRFGAQGLTATVRRLKVYRDVYYAAEDSIHAGDKPYQLASDELFVLGDNSPVSYDSRKWLHPGVPTKLLLGKPFIVHLPSRPARLKTGERELLIRLPDWERVRWIH